MLADQIEEQRLRKELERQRRAQQEADEERRLARERRELEQRYQRERAVNPGGDPGHSDAGRYERPSGAQVHEVIPSPAAATRRRRGGSKTTTRGGFQSTVESSNDPWGDASPQAQRASVRRRRRRRTESTWRGTEREQKRTWRDPNDDSLSLPLQTLEGPGTRNTSSPTKWLSENLRAEQDTLTVARESRPQESMRKTRIRRQRSGRRERERERARDSYAEDSYSGQWPAAGMSVDDSGPTAGDGIMGQEPWAGESPEVDGLTAGATAAETGLSLPTPLPCTCASGLSQAKAC